MNRLLLYCAILLSLLHAQVHAIIWARTVWTKPNGQVVELWFNAHAHETCSAYSLTANVDYHDQKKLLDRYDTLSTCQTQKNHILAYAKKYGKNIHFYLEDTPPLSGASPKKSSYCCLTGLGELLHKSDVAYSDLEPHIGSSYRLLLKEIQNYKDGSFLRDYYARTKTITDTFKNTFLSSYIFDVRLVHAISTGTNLEIPRQIFIGDALHCQALALALPLLGYAQDKEKTVIQKESTLNTTIQTLIDIQLGSSWLDYEMLRTTLCTPLIPHKKLRLLYAFQISHPITIHTLYDNDEKLDQHRAHDAALKNKAHKDVTPSENSLDEFAQIAF